MSELPDALELWPRFPFHKHDDEASGHRLRFVHVFSCFYIIKLMKEEENKVAKGLGDRVGDTVLNIMLKEGLSE